MKTILLVTPYWKEPHRWMAGGVKLAELWQRLGYRVIAVCMGSQQGVEQVSDTLTIHRRKDFFLKDPFNYGIAPGFGLHVWKLARREKPDIIIVNKILFWSSIVLIPLRLLGYRVLLLTDVLAGMTWWWRGTFASICGAIYAWTLGWLITLFASKIVFYHPQPPTLLKRLGIAKKSIVIPTGIDSTLYEVERGKRKEESVTVSYVGRLESVKGADDFLAAVAPLTTDYRDLKIQVVGWYPSTSSGQANHPLVEQYKDRVTFTGLREDIPAVLAATDIFVMPSYSEGLSNAIMEAMSSGCACVVSAVGGNRYLIENGVSGFHFTPGDREELKAHIRRLIDDPAKRRALGEAARKRIETVFDWKIVGEQYRRLFDDFSA